MPYRFDFSLSVLRSIPRIEAAWLMFAECVPQGRFDEELRNPPQARGQPRAYMHLHHPPVFAPAGGTRIPSLRSADCPASNNPEFTADLEACDS